MGTNSKKPLNTFRFLQQAFTFVKYPLQVFIFFKCFSKIFTIYILLQLFTLVYGHLLCVFKCFFRSQYSFGKVLTLSWRCSLVNLRRSIKKTAWFYFRVDKTPRKFGTIHQNVGIDRFSNSSISNSYMGLNMMNFKLFWRLLVSLLFEQRI